MWLHSLKVAQLLRSAACLHTNQSRSYFNHLVIRFEAQAESFHAGRKTQLEDGGGKILLGDKISNGAVVLGDDHVWVCWVLGLNLCTLKPRLAKNPT